MEIINLIKMQSTKESVKTYHQPELWWVLLNHPGNIEAVVKLQRTKTIFQIQHKAEESSDC